MNYPEPNIRVKVDVTNPGQFFACCGLLELADRLWPGVEGWFDKNQFLVSIRECKPADIDAIKLFESFTKAEIQNSMTVPQIERRNYLSSKKAKDRTSEDNEEKKQLDKLWRESAIVLDSFGLIIDWFKNKENGGSVFKTWAGQQSVIDIFLAMKESLVTHNECFNEMNCLNWLFESINNDQVPFYFDSALSKQGSSVDLGFGLDSLKMSSSIRPMIEYLAFIGLQRFRPSKTTQKNVFVYSAWKTPVTVLLASALCSKTINSFEGDDCEFSLLYRTDYLKSFLPAKRLSKSNKL